MSEYTSSLRARAKTITAILLAAVFMTTAASVLASRPVSAGLDLNPYIDLTINVSILRFRAIDNMNPDFSCVVEVDNCGVQGYPYRVHQLDYSPTDWILTFNVDDTIPEPVVKIHLYCWTDSIHYVECDLSSSPNYAVVHYDLTTARWHGAPEYNTVDWLGDPNGYGHVSGEEDLVSTDKFDCEVWFLITQNDNDFDGLTYQQEVNGFTVQDGLLGGFPTETYYTDPTVTNYVDFDGDDLDSNAEYNAGTLPTLKDSDGDKIWDGFEVRHPNGANAYKLNPRISTDAKPFMEKMLAEYDKIPNLLTGLTAWMVYAELQQWLNAYAHNVLGQICSPPGSYALAQGLLLGFGDLAFSVSWAPSFAFACLMYWQATQLANAATTFDQGLWMFNPTDGHTYGYIEQSRIGAKDLGANPAYTIADPKFEVATQEFKYHEGSIAWYYNEMAKVLRFLLGQSGSGASNWDNRPAIEFEDILYIHKTWINPLFDPQLNSGGKSFPSPSSYNFMYTKKDANGNPTQLGTTITESGYELEHRCMEFVKAVDQGFDFNHYSGIARDARLAFIGTGPDGSPLNAISPVRVWVASADLCSIGYGTYETIRMLRESSSTLLSYQNDWAAPVITSVSINQGATYTMGSAVTVDVVVTESGTGTTEIHFYNEGNGWSDWDTYLPSKSWVLTTGEGQKTVTVQVRDRLGFLSNQRQDTIILDTANPVISNFVINNGGVYASSQTVTLTITASDTGSGLNGMRLNNEGGTWTDWESVTPSKQWVLSIGLGLKTVNIEVRDLAGRVSTRSDQITLDTQAPTASVQISNGALYTNTVYVLLQITASDSGLSGIAGMRLWDWRTNTWTAWTQYSTSYSWPLQSGDGIKIVSLQVKDRVGLISATVTSTITLDTVNPTGNVVINNDAPYAWSSTVTLSIGASDLGSGIQGVRLSNDGSFATSPLLPWSPEKSWTLAPGEGSKTVWVMLVDQVNNFVVVSDSISVDLTRPSASIVINGGASPTNSASVILTISASHAGPGVLTMRVCNDWNWDSAQWEPLASTKAWTIGSSQDRICYVALQVRDDTGNTVEVTASIRLDTQPPTIQVMLNEGSSYTTSATVRLRIHFSDGGSYGSGLGDSMRLSNDGVWDTEPWQAFNPWVYWVLPSGDGEKTVYVQVYDAAGNVGSADSTIILDTTAPVTTDTLSGIPGTGMWYYSDVTVTLDATDGEGSGVASTMFRTDPAGAWNPYSGPFTVSGNGIHTFEFYSTDILGNIEAVKSDFFGIDCELPQAAITINGGDMYTKSPDVTLALSASDSVSGFPRFCVRYSNNQLLWTNWWLFASTCPWSLATGEGSRTVYCQVKDNAGNTFTAYNSITVDTISPVTTASATGSKVTLTASDATSGVATTYYAIDSGSFQPYSTTVDAGIGTHTVYYYSVDKAGNVESTKSIQVVGLDTSPPVTTATLTGTVGTNGWYRSTVTVTLTATDASGVKTTSYKIDTATKYSTYTGPFQITTDAKHTVYFYSVDTKDNTETPAKSVSVWIDKTPPTTASTLTGTKDKRTGIYTGPVTVKLSATDAMSGIAAGLTMYRMDGGSWIVYSSQFVVSGSGTHKVEFYSFDLAGNMELTKSTSFTIK